MSTPTQESTAKLRASASTPAHARPHVPVNPAPPPHTPWQRADTVTWLGIALLGFATRFLGLTSPTSHGTPVFDEKHYVPQGWDMVRSFMNPVLGGIESNPGFGLVVHPPLGKQLLALGEAVFGYTPLGWRVMTALFGVLTILATMALARVITQSWLVAFFAGWLAVLDGVLLVSSKFGMLDIFQVFFVVVAALALAIDHHQMRQRMHQAWREGLVTGPFGPRFGFRWWRFGAGVLLGCALAVKWSGLYYIAFFGLMSVFMDLGLRKRYGVPRPVVGTLVRDVIPALASLVLIPVLLYIFSWRAWFASETSVYRHAALDGTIEEDSWLHMLPDAWAGWMHYHLSVLDFHSELTTSGGHSHPWDSKPWAWLVAARPILYYSATGLECAAGECRASIYLFGTPIIWWLTVPVVAWALWLLLIRRDRRFVIPLVAFGAGFIPWLIAYDRQMYFFYATAMVPFSIILIAMALGMLVGRGRPVAWTARLTGFSQPTGTVCVVVYLAAVLAMFAYFSPLLYGYIIPEVWYQQLMWLPSWK